MAQVFVLVLALLVVAAESCLSVLQHLRMNAFLFLYKNFTFYQDILFITTAHPCRRRFPPKKYLHC